MRIVKHYSHLNGLEYLQVHKPKLWEEICVVIAKVRAADHKKKISKEKTRMGRELYGPIHINKAFNDEFAKKGWQQRRTQYWVTDEAALIRKTLFLSAAEQKKMIDAAGKRAIASYNQTDFVKDRVAIEVQLGKYSFVAYDLFVKHLAFYVGDVIDVGIEILAMKELQEQMSSGPGYYEGELYNLVRQGRGVPGVPLVLVGIAP